MIAKILRWFPRIAEFAFVQLIAQLLLAVSGFIIVRSMEKTEYAWFAIANSMLSAANLLADRGIGIGVRSIGGQVWQDPNQLGSLVSTAIQLRKSYLVVAVALAIPFAVWLLHENGADAQTILVLTILTIVCVIPQSVVSIFVPVCQLHGQYRKLQFIDLGLAVFRVLSIGLLAAASMNVVTLLTLAVATSWIHFFFVSNIVRKYTNQTSVVNANYRNEIQSISYRTLPNTIFFCLQGQITFLLLTLFGDVEKIADYTALGRISILLSVVGSVFSAILSPVFSRTHERNQLRILYAQFLCIAIVPLLPLLVLSIYFPELTLSILGPKYIELATVCWIAVFAGCISQFGGVMWSLNSAKAWITCISTFHIPLTIASQALLILTLDLTRMDHVLFFGLATSIIPIPLYACDAYMGLRGKTTTS